MSKQSLKKLSATDKDEIINILRQRFEKNMMRHKGIEWKKVKEKFEMNNSKLWSLNEMEETGGEPDVVGFDKKSGEYIFMDCSEESPKGRRSLCYDRDGLESRKEHRPENSAIDMAKDMGVSILSEEQYFELQKFGHFDSKTSSWLKTPSDVREHGGAISGEFRFGRVFVYANGAQSYFGSRGFRGLLRV